MSVYACVKYTYCPRLSDNRRPTADARQRARASHAQCLILRQGVRRARSETSLLTFHSGNFLLRRNCGVGATSACVRRICINNNYNNKFTFNLKFEDTKETQTGTTATTSGSGVPDTPRAPLSELVGECVLRGPRIRPSRVSRGARRQRREEAARARGRRMNFQQSLAGICMTPRRRVKVVSARVEWITRRRLATRPAVRRFR
ncbi:hypothetical protein EVAR_46967_1 [Eumeta japonica]|uniref:Uncharacterized protein n=1 Tax=Eumeta variegata TaxID=151549 RepID=A0A4C1X586_EUMVA|nr:hypothetical protein EVAR_46967_1 [Eumeta japonica]